MSESTGPAAALGVSEQRTSQPPQTWLALLFFVSGFPALIYQIVWQRALFTIYGVNVESVTVVVTAFMLGLGLGSLAGGQVSRARVPLIPVFAIVEICIGIYGAFSLRLFHAAAQFTAGATTFRTGVCAFALIVIPTVLMGSTLPVLLAYLVRAVPNMGRATGILYFVNTLGSAAACFVAGQFTMRLLGMSGSVRLAACLNGLVGLSALAAWFVLRRRLDWGGVSASLPAVGPPRLPLYAGAVLAALSGFIALGYEIVWYRVFSWASGTNPKTFAFMLGAYLAGLAAGALAIERRCRANHAGADDLGFTAFLLLGGNILAVLVAPVFSYLVLAFPWELAQPIALLVLAGAAAMLGTTFPLVCHLAVRPDDAAGQGVSFLYLANIIGSAAGSFVAGYVLPEIFTLPGICTLFAGAGIVLGVVLMFKSGSRYPRYALYAALAGACVLALITPIYRQTYERLSFKQRTPTFPRVVENRHGVIAVAFDGRTVLGGGVYDGVFNIDPLHDANLINRCYSMFGVLSRPPKHVLMIGLSTGSWAQVIANHPEVESFTIVEINPGYLALIPEHPEVASLLRNPKVNIVIDDGHRWLLRHPDAKFDLVVMNTTFFWRANVTNLLSREFLELVRRHLEPGGTHFYNTTSSPETQFTAVSALPYAVRIGNFIAVSDAPLRFDAERWIRLMRTYRIDGRPLLDLSRPADQNFLSAILQAAADVSPQRLGFFEYEPSLRARLSGRTVVTDDNMAVEWRGQQPQN